jgi:hypothetical protein
MNFLTTRVKQLCQDQELPFVSSSAYHIVFNDFHGVMLVNYNYSLLHVFETKTLNLIKLKNFPFGFKRIFSAEQLGFLVVSSKTIELLNPFTLEKTKSWDYDERLKNIQTIPTSKGMIVWNAKKVFHCGWEEFSKDSLEVLNHLSLSNESHFYSFALSDSKKMLVMGSQFSTICYFDLSFQQDSSFEELSCLEIDVCMEDEYRDPWTQLFSRDSNIWILTVAFFPNDDSQVLFTRTNNRQNRKIFKCDLVSKQVTQFFECKVGISTLSRAVWITQLCISQNFMIHFGFDWGTEKFFKMLLEKDSLKPLRIMNRPDETTKSIRCFAKKHLVIFQTPQNHWFISKS